MRVPQVTAAVHGARLLILNVSIFWVTRSMRKHHTRALRVFSETVTGALFSQIPPRTTSMDAIAKPHGQRQS